MKPPPAQLTQQSRDVVRRKLRAHCSLQAIIGTPCLLDSIQSLGAYNARRDACRLLAHYCGFGQAIFHAANFHQICYGHVWAPLLLLAYHSYDDRVGGTGDVLGVLAPPGFFLASELNVWEPLFLFS